MSEWKPKRKFVDPNTLTRKVFDKHVDRIELRRKRDVEDHRADMKALLARLVRLEEAHEDLLLHVGDHCDFIEDHRTVATKADKDGNEELG